MLAIRDVELARETVRELYDRGQVERARAIETILTQALTASETGSRAPADSLTLGQVARRLGVSPRIIEDWVASGELPTARIGSGLRVSREALKRHLDRLRERQQQRSNSTPAEVTAAGRQHEFVVAGLPAEKVGRLEVLIEKRQDGRRLSQGERDELALLERELAALAGARLAESTGQASRSQTAP